jgi:hypothetical protein
VPLPFQRITSCDFAPGGFLGFSARDWMGCWINLTTLGAPGFSLTHVAPIARSPIVGDPLLVYESTTFAKRPCCRRGAWIDGVQAHPLRERIDEFDGGPVYYYAPKVPLTPVESVIFTEYLEAQLGKSYDTWGAVRSRDMVLAAIRRLLFGEEDLSDLFCSELLAAAERKIGRFKSRNASRWSPNHAARAATIGWPFAEWGAEPCFKWPVRAK